MYNELITVYRKVINDILSGNSVDVSYIEKAYISHSKALDLALINNQSTADINTVREAEMWLIQRLSV